MSQKEQVFNGLRNAVVGDEKPPHVLNQKKTYEDELTVKLMKPKL